MRAKIVAIIVGLLLATSAWAAYVPAGSVAATTTNSSSTITTGGTFQTIAASSSTRRSLKFQNVCNKSGNCTATTNNCYLYIAANGSPTTANSFVIGPGQFYSETSGVISSDAIRATCDGTGDAFALTVQ